MVPRALMQASSSRLSDSSVTEQEKSAWMMVWSLGSKTGSSRRDSAMIEVTEGLARHCGRI
jgi:hypothetical protein